MIKDPLYLGNAIDFVVRRTKLPRELVEKLLKVEIPSSWSERIKAILDNVDRPDALELQAKMIRERVGFVRNLPVEEILETEEIKETYRYVERLKLEGCAAEDHAAIFAVAVLEWSNHLEKVIIEALNRSEKK